MAEDKMGEKKLDGILMKLPLEKRKKIKSILMTLPEERMEMLEREMLTMSEEDIEIVLDEVVKEIEEKEKKKEYYETVSNVIYVVCFIIGLIVGIKFYFMDPKHGFMNDLISTCLLIGLIELVGKFIFGFFIDAEDL